MKALTSRLPGTALAFVAATVLIGCEKAPESPPATLGIPVTVDTRVDDTFIPYRDPGLLADPGIEGLGDSVVTDDGRVQFSGFVDDHSQTALAQMIQENLVAERFAIDSYRDVVRYLGDRDPGTSDLLKQILAVEQDRADVLADLLESMPSQPV
jgi:hypothetical protein